MLALSHCRESHVIERPVERGFNRTQRCESSSFSNEDKTTLYHSHRVQCTHTLHTKVGMYTVGVRPIAWAHSRVPIYISDQTYYLCLHCSIAFLHYHYADHRALHQNTSCCNGNFIIYRPPVYLLRAGNKHA